MKPETKPKEPVVKDTEPYIRSTDGARMVPIEPGSFVAEAVARILAKAH